MLMTDMAEFNYLGFDWISGMERGSWPDGIDQHRLSRVLIWEAAPCISHAAPVNFIVKRINRPVVHDYK